MKTIEINVYKFKELDKQTQRKVIENYRHINVDDFQWYDWIKDDFNRLGLEIQEFDLGRRNYAKIYIENFEDTSNYIIKEFGDSVLIKQTAKNYLKELKEIVSNFKEDEDIDREFETLDEKYQHEFEADILSYLRANYESDISDEAVIDTIEANDYNFTWNGEIFKL